MLIILRPVRQDGTSKFDTNYNPREEGGCRWKLRVSSLINLPVETGILIDDISHQRDLNKSIPRASHIKLLPEESQLANARLRERARSEPESLGGGGALQRMTALVLVENEVTTGGHYDHWQDVTGERYQFPNQYRGKVTPGRPFIYYRGVRRGH